MERLTTERDRVVALLATAEQARSADARTIASLRSELESDRKTAATRESELSGRLTAAEAATLEATALAEGSRDGGGGGQPLVLPGSRAS